MTTIILRNNNADDVVNDDYDVVIAVVVNVVAAVRVCMSLCGLLASIFGEEKKLWKQHQLQAVEVLNDWLTTAVCCWRSLTDICS